MTSHKYAEFKGGIWKCRPLTIRDDGIDGIPNFVRWLVGLPPSGLCWSLTVGPITLGPGESIEMMFPLPEELQP